MTSPLKEKSTRHPRGEVTALLHGFRDSREAAPCRAGYVSSHHSQGSEVAGPDPSVGGALLRCGPGRGPPCLTQLLVLWSPWANLFTWLLPVTVSLFPLKDTVTGLGSFPLQQDLILTDYTCKDPTSK